MQELGIDDLDRAHSLGLVHAMLRRPGAPVATPTPDVLWTLLMAGDAAHYERSAPVRLLAAFTRASMARRLDLAGDRIVSG
ncbi:hypothetical protein GCM10009846_25800 [Agrococcus versicolor]|uniref:Uncharacterized protein n=2 Tax=Agrococcus versicolor TaxID=501482 RepID=A0ABN3AX06_9MICO